MRIESHRRRHAPIRRPLGSPPGARWLAAFVLAAVTVVTVAVPGAAEHSASAALPELGSVVFSPDSKLVATAAADGTVRIWDVAGGRSVHTLRGHDGTVNSAMFSPDGKLILTAGQDGTARIWDVASGRGLHVLSGSGPSNLYERAAFSPDGKLVVIAHWDRTARIADVASGRNLGTLEGHSDSVTSAVFSPDGKLVVTASKDGTARIWNVAGGRSRHTLRGHTGTVESAVFALDGALVLTVDQDGTARIWDVASGRRLRTLSDAGSAVVSPDGKLVATGGSEVRIREVATGRTLRTLRDASHLMFSPDGKLVVTADDSDVRIWDVASGRRLRTLSRPTGVVVSAVFSPDGKLVATASLDGTAWIFDVASGRSLRRLPPVTALFRVLDSDTLQVQGPINGLAADGASAAVLTVSTSGWPHAGIWTPRARGVQDRGAEQNEDLADSWSGIALAGGVAAWLVDFGSNGTQTGIGTSRPDLFRPPVFPFVHAQEQASGRYVGRLVGDGNLLAWNEWTMEAESDDPGSQGYGRSHLTGGSLHAWQRGSLPGRTILKGVDSLYLVAASNGRLLIRHPDGSLDVVTDTGKTVRRFVPLPVTRGVPDDHGNFKSVIRFEGDDVVAIRAGKLVDLSVRTGRVERTWTVPANARLADVQDGVAAAITGDTVTLVDLRTGRRSTVRPAGSGPVLAQLEPAGLSYTYRSGGLSFVRLLPLSEIRDRLAS